MRGEGEGRGERKRKKTKRKKKKKKKPSKPEHENCSHPNEFARISVQLTPFTNRQSLRTEIVLFTKYKETTFDIFIPVHPKQISINFLVVTSFLLTQQLFYSCSTFPSSPHSFSSRRFLIPDNTLKFLISTVPSPFPTIFTVTEDWYPLGVVYNLYPWPSIDKLSFAPNLIYLCQWRMACV